MLYVERHVINQSHPAFQEIDKASFASKNLYNKALYETRQKFFETGKTISQSKLDKLLKQSEEYKALPAKVSQLILMKVYNNWAAFFAGIKEYSINPAKFSGQPKIPKYLDKNGRFILEYNNQAINAKTALKNGIIFPSGLIKITMTKQDPKKIKQFRIVPQSTKFVVEVVYETSDHEKVELDKSLYASIDIGVDNLATVTLNRPGFVPIAVSGRELKSINQFYNKRRAEFQALLKKDQYKSKQLKIMDDKRYWRVQDIFHKASRTIVDMLVKEKVGTLIIGKNVGWKQNSNMGYKNNQKFCFIPHARFIDMLTYKAQMEGINVICREESYTSKCSFLDNEPICHHEQYVGKRIKRGLFRSANGNIINADCNGSYNIMRKEDENVFPKPVVMTRKGIEGYVVHPNRVTIKMMNSKKLNQIN